jgi:hypothetical protein
MPVIAFQQVRLRAAAHLPDQSCGLNQHLALNQDLRNKGSFYGSWHLAIGPWLLDTRVCPTTPTKDE